MSNELVPIDSEMLPITSSADPKKLDKLAGSGFLPYVLLIGSSSNANKEGKAPVGQWTLNRGKDNSKPLTSSFEVLVLARRARANRKTAKGILSYFDQDHPEYKKIEVEAAGGGMTGCWHGTEYLLFIPSEKEFATYHASNATARTASKELNTILQGWDDALRAEQAKAKEDRMPVPKPQAKFACTLITYGNGNKQWGPVFTRATTPFTVTPKFEDVIEQCKAFCNPKQSKVETAPQAAASNEDMG